MWSSFTQFVYRDSVCQMKQGTAGSRDKQWRLCSQNFLALALLFILLCIMSSLLVKSTGRPNRETLWLSNRAQGNGLVLVSYSYFEKDDGQRQNFDYFILEGLGIDGVHNAMPALTDFSIVVNGDICSPCTALRPLVNVLDVSLDGISEAWGGPHLTMLHRIENFGMDFAAHNVTLLHLQQSERLHTYKYFIFLNSSVRGPFFPSWIQSSIPAWQWTDAFLSKLTGDVKLVASSIVCLPPMDAGGYGPKAESWGLALDYHGLELLIDKGIFWMRTCKLCAGNDGIVVASEYGMSKVILEAGYNMATLLARYAQETDWRDVMNWNCNDNVHPSRHGTYDGISMHPYETVFVKESWHVGEPFLSRYTRWQYAHSSGKFGTEGSFNACLYKHAVSEEGRNPQRTKELFLAHGMVCPGVDE